MKKILLPTILISLACAYGQPTVTKADVDEWMETLSNWGRWGDDDQLGAINLITPETRLAAAKLRDQRCLSFPRTRCREGGSGR